MEFIAQLGREDFTGRRAQLGRQSSVCREEFPRLGTGTANAEQLWLASGRGEGAGFSSGSFCLLQGAAAVAGAGVTQSICLPLLSVYQLSSNGAIQVGAAGFTGAAPAELCPMAVLGAEPSCSGRPAATLEPEGCQKGMEVVWLCQARQQCQGVICVWPVQGSASSRRSLDAPSWPGVYRLCMSLMERLLKTLRYNFLTEALDFVGVHQERILQVHHSPLWWLPCSVCGNIRKCRSSRTLPKSCRHAGRGWWSLLELDGHHLSILFTRRAKALLQVLGALLSTAAELGLGGS